MSGKLYSLDILILLVSGITAYYFWYGRGPCEATPLEMVAAFWYGNIVMLVLAALTFGFFIPETSVISVEPVQDKYDRKGKYRRFKLKMRNFKPGEGEVVETFYAEKAPLATLASDLILVYVPPGKPAHEGEVLLIKRADQGIGSSNAGKWAIPGGCVPDAPNVTTLSQAITELWEETGYMLTPSIETSLVGIYDAPYRDSRKRFVSIAYLAIISEKPTLPDEVPCGHEVDERRWFNLSDVAIMLRNERYMKKRSTAFDHHLALVDMMQKLHRNEQLLSMLGGQDGIDIIKHGRKA